VLYKSTTTDSLLLKVDHLLFRPDLHDFPWILFLELVLKEANVSANVLPAIAELGQRRLEHFEYALGRNHFILTTATSSVVCFNI